MSDREDRENAKATSIQLATNALNTKLFAGTLIVNAGTEYLLNNTTWRRNGTVKSIVYGVVGTVGFVWAASRENAALSGMLAAGCASGIGIQVGKSIRAKGARVFSSGPPVKATGKLFNASLPTGVSMLTLDTCAKAQK